MQIDIPDHEHTHGVVDPEIVSTSKGIWAVKWSFIGLMITTIFQSIIVYFSSSVALLADTIHNLGNALTATPLYSVEEGLKIACDVRYELLNHLQFVSNAIIQVDPVNASGERFHGHH